MQDGKVIWYHHQENDKEVFNVVTLPCIPAHNWTHIAVTYDSQAMLAIVYVNGILVKAKSASGDLSQDWGHFAGIGRHFYEGTFLSGLIDEFVIYNYALNGTIRYLAQGRCWWKEHLKNINSVNILEDKRSYFERFYIPIKIWVRSLQMTWAKATKLVGNVRKSLISMA